jgi:hypothetical protein
MSRWAWFGLLLCVSPALAAEPTVRLLGPTGPAAQHWPGWRGPSLQGHAVGTNFPDAWSPTENVRWRVPVPGAGHSSPIVWADRIFLTTAHDKGSKRSLLCFDRATGRQVWECAFAHDKPEKIGFKNNHASSTPCTDGTHIYAYFGNLGLVCVDWDGREVWRVPFAPVNARHGMAGSPLLYQERVILYQDHFGPGSSFVAAYERRTGKQVWKTLRKEQVGWGTPIAVRVADRDEIIVHGQYRTVAYHPDDGRELWSCQGNTEEVVPTPVLAHDLLFCCSGRAGPTFALRPGGTGDITTQRVEWSAIKGAPFIPSPIVVGDYLFMVNDMLSIATCYAAKTGKLMWQERLGKPAKEGFTASPVSADGKVFFTNDAGETYVLAATGKFDLLRVNRLDEPILASPAAVAGQWFIRTTTHLYCIGR